MSAELVTGGDYAVPSETVQPTIPVLAPADRLRQRLQSLYGSLDQARQDPAACAELAALEEEDDLIPLSSALKAKDLFPAQVQRRIQERLQQQRTAAIVAIHEAIQRLNAAVEARKPYNVAYDRRHTGPDGRLMQGHPGIWKVHALQQPASRLALQTIRYDIPDQGKRWLETITDGYWVPGIAYPESKCEPLLNSPDNTQPRDALGLLVLSGGSGALLNHAELEQGWRTGTAFYVPADYFEPLPCLNADFRTAATVITGLAVQK